MKARVYIETTIPSYLMAWPSRDILRTAHQQVTQEWWTRRSEFDLFISQQVVTECQDGDQVAAAERLAAIHDLKMLDLTPDVIALAEALVREVPIPPKAAADAVHIATASVHRVQYLLTWNCTHLANAVLRPKIEGVCRNAGFEPPIICTPQELPPPQEQT